MTVLDRDISDSAINDDDGLFHLVVKPIPPGPVGTRVWYACGKTDLRQGGSRPMTQKCVVCLSYTKKTS